MDLLTSGYTNTDVHTCAIVMTTLALAHYFMNARIESQS